MNFLDSNQTLVKGRGRRDVCAATGVSAASIEAELKAAHDITPGLAVILVGSRKDSQSYAGCPSSEISWWILNISKHIYAVHHILR